MVVSNQQKSIRYITTLFSKERAAWNEVESGSTGKLSQPSTYLIELQGKLEKCG